MAFRMIQPKSRLKKKKAGNAQEILQKLADYLNGNCDVPAEILCGFWRDQANVFTYQELRMAVMDGYLNESTWQQWTEDYSKLVNNRLRFMWENALFAGSASQPVTNELESFVLDMGRPTVLSWIKDKGGHFITNCVDEQRKAVAYLTEKTVKEKHSVDELARLIRPCVGLTKPQAKSNLLYYDNIVQTLRKDHPRMREESIQKRAREAAAKYAEKQHRQRAMMIAQTEMAYAFNKGADEGIRQAQEQGLVGTTIKRWCTAGDRNVCTMCRDLEGKEIGMDDKWQFGPGWDSWGNLTPPAHPRCGCAVEYIETEKPIFLPEPDLNGEPKVPADLQMPPGMTYVDYANFGGTGEMYIYEDANGNQWLFKPAHDKYSYTLAEFRAYSQEAGYKVQGIVDPDTAVKVGTGTLDGKFGAYQEKLNTVSSIDLKDWQNGYGCSDIDIQQSGILQQLQREHTTDWLLGNFDSHGGNFVMTADGKLIGIDKEQSFKYISDVKSRTMSYSYHPNSYAGETEPIYNTMYRKYARGELSLDLNESLQYIQRVEAISDSDYREIFRDYAESLFGKGAKAEKLLDDIAERKITLRETYRTFFSSLETERTGAKTVFQFADEIAAGTASPVPPVIPKPARTAAGYRMSDVLDDMSILPDTQYGAAIRSDGKKLEGLDLAGRKVTISGSEYYEFTGKLTEDAWEDTVKKMNRRGYQDTFDFLRMRDDGTYKDGDIAFSLNDGLSISEDRSTFEIYSDTARKRKYSFSGYFRVRIEATGDSASDRRALEDILGKAGLKDIISDSTVRDENILKKAKLAWQIDPKALNQLKGMPINSARDNPRWKEIDKILKQNGVKASRIKNMEWKEVFPGYTTLIDEEAVKEYKKAGMTHVWCGVNTADSVVAILESDGLACSNNRFTSGMANASGASPMMDMETGGAGSVFTRMGVKTDVPYKHASVAGGAYRFIMTPEVAGRTDWYAYNGDCFGTAKGDTYNYRDSSLDFVKEASQKYYDASNEMMFRTGISKKEFVGISCENDSLRTDLLDELRRHGINEINGIGIEDFVHVSTRPRQDSELGLKGLAYYN